MQPRPSLTLRKPTTVSPDAVAAFVAASDGEHESTPSASGPVAPALRAVAAMEPVAAAEPAGAPGHTRRADVPSFRRASRAVIERRTRPARRRTTVYLDVDVAAELARALAQRDQELSDAVNGAIRTWLDAIK
jgi:hypothetical protein